MQLRDYQTQAIQDLRSSVATGHRSPLYVLPTGGGKTAVAVTLIEQAVAKGKSCLFLAPRRELIYQTSQRLYGSEIEHGVIMAGERPRLMPQVQVACIPTLHAREKGDRFRLPPANLVLVDEAHLGVGGRAQETIEHYQDKDSVVVGLTATACRKDGRGLGAIYDDLVEGPSIRSLIDEGYLVQPRHFSGSHANLEGIKVQAGDYNQRQLGERVESDFELIGDVVSNYLRLAGDRQGFCFGANVAHSMHLAERFSACGIVAEHLDGKTPLEERKAIQRRFREGITQVICNCDVYTYGVDIPQVSAIVLAKPTKSLAKYLQMLGRGLRTYPGKEDCLILDHGGAIQELGFADDIQPWSLDGKEKISERKEKEAKEPKYIECGDCGVSFRAAKCCPNCGNDMGERFAKAVVAREAELEEVKRGEKKKAAKEWTMDEKGAFFAQLKGHAYNKRYNEGWAAHAYRDRLGVWPNGVKHVERTNPSPETAAWIQHLNIKRAKRREKERKAA